MTGFEFGNKRAVPVCTGVVVAAENEKKVKAAWTEWNEEQKRKEEGKMEKICLDLWRKMVMGLRIRERIVGDFDTDVLELVDDRIEAKPLNANSDATLGTAHDEDEGMGGGFLLPQEDEEGATSELILDQAEPVASTKKRKGKATDQYPTPTSIPGQMAHTGRPRRSLLRDTSLELSGLSSSEASESDEASISKHDHDVTGPEFGREGDLSSDDKSRSQSSSNQANNARSKLKDTAPPSNDFSRRNRSPESSLVQSSDNETEAEEYIPRTTRSGRMSTSRRGKLVDEISSQPSPPSSSRRIPARTAVSKAQKMDAPTTKRRVLRRDSTLVTSPYFDG